MRPTLNLAFLIALLGILVVSCRAQPDGGLRSGLSLTPAATSRLSAVLPASDVAVGKNQRFLVLLVDTDNRVVADARVNLAFFKVTGPNQAQPRGQTSARFSESPGLPGQGVYVSRTDFDEAGLWGVQVQVDQPGHPSLELNLSFDVKERSSTPALGERAPASQTLTGTDPAEIERFSSARPIDPDLYRLSVAAALDERKPLAVLFATPGFCTSRLCGPSLDVLQTLRAEFGERANYIHVEIYKDGRPNQQMELVPAVREWGLTSEPWLFIVGADGRLVEKLEGNITLNEARPALEAALRAT